MSLKNSVKSEIFVATATAENGSIVTVVGERRQTSMKESFIVQRAHTTPGGEIISVDDEMIALPTFDNQDGIRKEFYMGYSICHKDDVDDYKVDTAIELAKRRFTRPLVTYNFTYLNTDMCDVLVNNEADYIANNINKYI